MHCDSFRSTRFGPYEWGRARFSAILLGSRYKGTPAEGSRIEINTIPIEGKCLDCDKIFSVKKLYVYLSLL